MLSVVVLPAPFGPTRPKNEPTGMSRDSPLTAILRSKRLYRPRMETAARGSGGGSVATAGREGTDDDAVRAGKPPICG